MQAGAAGGQAGIRSQADHMVNETRRNLHATHAQHSYTHQMQRASQRPVHNQTTDDVMRQGQRQRAALAQNHQQLIDRLKLYDQKQRLIGRKRARAMPGTCRSSKRTSLP